MKKQIVDCSLPFEHPDRIKTVDMSQEEEEKLLIEWEKLSAPKPLTLEERIAALEQSK